MNKATNTLMATLNKKYGEGTIALAKDVKNAEITRIPSGSLFLDWALGTTPKGESGWALGRVVELFGPPSSGKSLISMKTIAKAQEAKLTCAYLDAEQAFDKDFAKTLGVNTDDLMLFSISEGERALDIACDIIKDGQVKVLVIDSVASLVPQAEIEKSLEEHTMAETARLMSKAIRKLIALNKGGCLIIFINQLRVNPGASYGTNPEYTPGGKALGFYSSIRLEIRRGDWIVNKDKDKIGQIIKFKVVKNKTASPYKDGFFKFLYTGEIDKVDELISLALLRNKLDKRGAYFYIDDDGFQGRENLEAGLKESPELYERLRKKVFENE